MVYRPEWYPIFVVKHPYPSSILITCLQEDPLSHQVITYKEALPTMFNMKLLMIYIFWEKIPIHSSSDTYFLNACSRISIIAMCYSNIDVQYLMNTYTLSPNNAQIRTLSLLVWYSSTLGTCFHGFRWEVENPRKQGIAFIMLVLSYLALLTRPLKDIHFHIACLSKSSVSLACVNLEVVVLLKP